MTTNKGYSKQATTRVVAVVILAVATALVIASVVKNSAPSGFVDQTEAAEKLKQLHQRYSAVRSVHLVAEAKITFYGTNFRIGSGSYEYWAEGERYKIRCRTDRDLGLLQDVDVAYDGERFYYLDRGILSYQQKDISKTIGAIPNPFFMPIDFFSIEDDDCRFCALRLTDFRAFNSRWLDRMSNLRIRSQVKDKQTGSLLTNIEMPGGTKNQRPFKILLHMTETDDAIHLSRINQVTLDQKVVASISFDKFKPTAFGEFPHIISSEGFDENGNVLFRLVYTINKLEINHPIGKNVFPISFDEAERVWDSDAKKLVKEKRRP